MQPISILILCFLFLSAAAGQTPMTNGQQPTANSRPLRIVVIGSSTAAGVGARPVDSSWVNRYSAYLKSLHPRSQVVNLAKSGYQTWHLMPSGHKPPPGRPWPDTLRNITAALDLRPDAILVNLPSNDASAGYPAREQLDNFEVIAFCAWAADVPLWITTVQPRNFDTLKIQIQYQVLQAMNKRFGDLTVNFWDGLDAGNGTVNPRFDSGDGIHLNNTGHALLYERIVAKNIPEQLAYRHANRYALDGRWAHILPLNDNLMRHPPLLPKQLPSVLLQAEQPMENVSVEVFDPNGRLLRRQTLSLPHILPTDFGPPGVYRIQLRKGAWGKTIRWVKI